MTSFRYKVKDKSGRTLDGITIGEDQRSAIEHLQKMGYFVLNITQVRERSDRRWNPARLLKRWLVNPIFFGASVYQLAVFYRQLATMVKSGMTIVHAMSSLSSQGGSRPLRKIASETVPVLQSGGKLSDAFAGYPWVFPELHISLIRAGETGGTLDKMLGKIADYLEREHGVRQKLRLATFYPKILVLAVILIPRFHILILGGLTPYMKATLAILLPVGIGLLALWVAFRLLSQIRAFRYGLDLVKLAVPKIGKTVKMLALSKFYRVLGAMYAAGSPLSQGLEHAAKACGNWYMATRLRRAIPWVEQGNSLSESLERTRILPRMGLDMLATGEQTGNIDEMLDKAAEYSENEAEVATIQTTIIVGVLLLLCVAAYIGCFVVQFYVGQYANVMNQSW